MATASEPFFIIFASEEGVTRCREVEVGENTLREQNSSEARARLIANGEDNSRARRAGNQNTPRERSLINKRTWDGSASKRTGEQ